MTTKTATADRPAYIMQSMLGGASVTYYKRESVHGGETTSSRTGSVLENLLEEFKGTGIPVIDMRTVEHYKSPPKYCRETSIVLNGEARRYCSLAEYVEFYRSIGATITEA